jgi:geranylgeranylglycerol-phosphate geranylgeranyltransferase
MKNYLKLARIANVVLIFLSIECGGILCGVDVLKSWKILIAALAAAMITGGGNALNRISDLEIERANKREGTAASPKFSRRRARILYSIATAASLMISAAINFYSFLLVLIGSILILAYTFRLKRMVFFGNFTVALVTGLTFIYAGTSVGDFKDVYPAAIFTFFVNLIREIVKDARDFDVDKSAGVETMAIRYGTNVSAYLSISLTVLLLFMAWGAYRLGILPIQFLTVCGLTIFPIGVYITYILISRRGFSEACFGYKLMMIFGLVALVVGKV